MTRRIARLLSILALALATLPGCASLGGGKTPATTVCLPPSTNGPTPTPSKSDSAPYDTLWQPIAPEPRLSKSILLDPVPEPKEPAPREEETPKTPALLTAQVKTPPRSPLAEALDCMLDDRHQDALKHLQAYDPETQEFFLGVLPTLTLATKKRLADLSTQEVAVLYEQMQSLLVTIRPRTRLGIEKLCFCDWVKGYGIYQPRDGRPFLASTPTRTGDQVQAYLELKNFTSAKTADGWYTTRLAVTGTLVDGDGKAVGTPLVWMDGSQPLRSRTRLHDHHSNCCFYIPVVPPGNYQLVLRVVDQTIPEHPRETSKSLDLRVTGIESASR